MIPENSSQENHSISIGRDAIGNVLVTGDSNQVTVTLVVADQRLISARQLQQQVPEAGADNPYRGLDAFQESDADLFFGREKLVRRAWVLFEKLQKGGGPRILAIVGASGSGKSSLVRAGFVPELVRQPMEGLEAPTVVVFRPGSNPLVRLIEVLARIPDARMPTVTALKTPDVTGCFATLHTHIRPKDAQKSRVILVIDQFEELYTACEDSEGRSAFLENLAIAAAHSDGLVTIVLTVRSDFAAAVRSPAVFSAAVRENRLQMRSMDIDELRNAITRPAARRGYTWPPSLVDSFVGQAEGRAGALPLLQFALKSMWHDLHGGALDNDRFTSRLIEDFLVQAAEALYESTPSDGIDLNRDQRIIRRAFLAMVQLGEGTEDTRRVARLSEIVAEREDPEDVRHVLFPFCAAETRLITVSEVDGEPTYELTHESLISSWDRLRTWLGDVPELDRRAKIRADLRLRHRLSAAARDWKSKSGGLWRTPELDLLRAYAKHIDNEMTTEEATFTRESIRLASRERALRISSVVMLACLAIAAAVGSMLAMRAASDADEQRTRAATAFAKSLVMNASPAAALKVLRERLVAERPDDPIDYNLAEPLYAALWSHHLVGSTVVEQAQGLAWDGLTGDLIVVTDREELRFNRAMQQTSSRESRHSKPDASFEHATDEHKIVSPDGSSYILAMDWGNIALHKKNGEVILNVQDRQYMGSLDPNDFNFSPDSKMLFLGHSKALNDSTAPEVVDVESGRQLFQLEVRAKVLYSAFSPSSDRLATVTDEGIVSIWSTAQNAFSERSGSTLSIHDRGESNPFAVLTAPGEIVFVRRANYEATLRVPVASKHQEAEVKFINGDKLVWIKDTEKTAELWSFSSGSKLLRVDGQDELTTDSTPSGRYAIVSDSSGARYYPVSGELAGQPVTIPDAADDTNYDPQETVVAFSDSNGVRVWRLDTGRLIQRFSFEFSRGVDSVVAVSPGVYLVLASNCSALIRDSTVPIVRCGKVPPRLVERNGRRGVITAHGVELSLLDAISGSKLNSSQFPNEIIEAELIDGTNLIRLGFNSRIDEERRLPRLSGKSSEGALFDYVKWQIASNLTGCGDADMGAMICDQGLLLLRGPGAGRLNSFPEGVLRVATAWEPEGQTWVLTPKGVLFAIDHKRKAMIGTIAAPQLEAIRNNRAYGAAVVENKSGAAIGCFSGPCFIVRSTGNAVVTLGEADCVVPAVVSGTDDFFCQESTSNEGSRASLFYQSGDSWKIARPIPEEIETNHVGPWHMNLSGVGGCPVYSIDFWNQNADDHRDGAELWHMASSRRVMHFKGPMVVTTDLDGWKVFASMPITFFTSNSARKRTSYDAVPVVCTPRQALRLIDRLLAAAKAQIQ